MPRKSPSPTIKSLPRLNRFSQLLNFNLSKEQEIGDLGLGSLRSSDAPKANIEGQKEGFIYRGPGRWEYDHTQDLEYLEQCQERAKRDQLRREKQECLPPKPFKRVTLGNASHQDLAEAAYSIKQRAAKKRGEE